MVTRKASSTITTAEARDLMALCGEIVELRDDPKVWRRHLLTRLIKVLHATAAMTVMARRMDDVCDYIMESYVDVGFSTAQRRIFLRWVYENPWQDPVAQGLLKRLPPSADPPPDNTITWARHELIADRLWYAHEYYNQVRKPMGFDHSLASVFCGPSPGHFIFIAVYRPVKTGKRFAPREVAILDLCHSALAWLYRAEEKHRPLDGALSPRLNQTLGYLMAGKSEKEIADLTELSIHTIHDYVKALYRHFQVSSRSELLARFISQ